MHYKINNGTTFEGFLLYFSLNTIYKYIWFKGVNSDT